MSRFSVQRALISNPGAHTSRTKGIGILLPSDWACLMRIMSLGFAMLSTFDRLWYRRLCKAPPGIVQAKGQRRCDDYNVMRWDERVSYGRGIIRGVEEGQQNSAAGRKRVALRTLLTGKSEERNEAGQEFGG